MYTKMNGAVATTNANSENTEDNAISKPKYNVMPDGTKPNIMNL